MQVDLTHQIIAAVAYRRQLKEAAVELLWTKWPKRSVALGLRLADELAARWSESPTAGLSDAHPRSSALVGAGNEPLALGRRESRVDQCDHHVDGEAVSEHHRLGAAVPA
jgi:hypothetical protein